MAEPVKKRLINSFLEVDAEYRDKVVRIVKYFHLNPNDLMCYTKKTTNDGVGIFVRSSKRDRFIFTWYPNKHQIAIWRYPDKGMIMINDHLALCPNPELPRRDILEELRKSAIK